MIVEHSLKILAHEPQKPAPLIIQPHIHLHNINMRACHSDIGLLLQLTRTIEAYYSDNGKVQHGSLS